MVTVVDRLLLNIEANTKGIEKTFRNLQNLFLSLGLAFLFTGMALQRFFQNVLTSLLTTFLTIEGETGVINERVNGLIAAFTFLKFSFFDAFAETGLLDKWINRIDALTTFFNSLDESTKAFLVNFTVNAFIAAKAMMLIGQTVLFMLAPLAAMKFLFGGIVSIFGPIGVVITIVISKLLLLTGLFVAIGLAFFILVKRAGGLKNAFRAMGMTILFVLALLGDSIMETLILPLRMVIFTINAVIRGINAISGKSIKLIRQPEFAVATKGILGARERLRQDIADDKRAQQQVVNNNITVEGNVLTEQQLFQKLSENLSQSMQFNQGGPQSGG